MSREIKFRAWDGKNMWEPDRFEVTGGGQKIWFWPNINNFIDKFSNSCLLQFTGLRDKNGKEIYEGDFVVIPDTFTETVDVGVGSVPIAQTPDNHIADVCFGAGEFFFAVTENADILQKGAYTWNQLLQETGVSEIEIVGNVYENPELLKV